MIEGRWLSALAGNWPRTVCSLLEEHESAVVRVLVADVLGSAPREPGAYMLVSTKGICGTIGGGNLEWQAMRAAHALLQADGGSPAAQVRRLVLASELGQCCGGVVQLWLERFTRADVPPLKLIAAAAAAGRAAAIVSELHGPRVIRRLLEDSDSGSRVQFSRQDSATATLIEPLEADAPALWLYGAGHVGQALIRVLAELPFQVTWIDPRAELLPPGLPDNVRPLCSSVPENTVQAAPASARFLIMTHDHALDYALCRLILQRGDFAWLGLIGSKSKSARFRSRLAREGVSSESLSRLICPIGVEGINSKLPPVIAVAVAAQLLQSLPTSGKLTSAGEPTEALSSARTAVASAIECSSTGCSRCSPSTP